MDKSNCYESAKKLFWPHIIVPFGLLIVLDYIELLSVLIKIVAVFWIIVQTLGFAVGFWAGGMIKFSSGQLLEFWKSVFSYRLSVIIPGITIGRDAIDWILFTDEKELEETEDEEYEEDPDYYDDRTD